eukprot:218957_1
MSDSNDTGALSVGEKPKKSEKLPTGYFDGSIAVLDWEIKYLQRMIDKLYGRILVISKFDYSNQEYTVYYARYVGISKWFNFQHTGRPDVLAGMSVRLKFRKQYNEVKLFHTRGMENFRNERSLVKKPNVFPNFHFGVTYMAPPAISVLGLDDEGVSLRVLFEKREKMHAFFPTVRAFLGACEILALCLRDLHKLYRIHGDVKPESCVFNERESHFKLMDLGIYFLERNSSLKRNSVNGSLGYIPIDMLTGIAYNAYRKLDVFSVAVTVAEGLKAGYEGCGKDVDWHLFHNCHSKMDALAKMMQRFGPLTTEDGDKVAEQLQKHRTKANAKNENERISELD